MAEENPPAQDGGDAPDPPPIPPRITELRLQNFRAFPGPATVPVRLAAKNAIIFGENGSGKSTIFHALDGFFSVAERTRVERRSRLQNSVNLFSGEGLDATSLARPIHETEVPGLLGGDAFSVM